VAGASVAELDASIDSVGGGAHPDAAGEPTLDAAVMCGRSARVGAVGQLRGVQHAALAGAYTLRHREIRFCVLTSSLLAHSLPAARLVLEHTTHSLLVGDAATQFASQFGSLERVSLQSAASNASWEAWREGGCQPSYWTAVAPDPSSSCGPFTPLDMGEEQARPTLAAVTPDMHDTLSIAVLDGSGDIAAATTTNGLAFKIPGRVGDAAIPGSGNYARNGIGACGATGDGDVLMRFLPCYQALESLRLGWSPLDAAEDALRRVAALEPGFQGALFVVAADGQHAGGCHNWVFQYTVRAEGDPAAVVHTVHPRPHYVPRGPSAMEDVRRRRTHWLHLLASAGLGAAVASLVASS
jgi:N4-(beta-N-acetylglucosaminyl)-L-asparaginase